MRNWPGCWTRFPIPSKHRSAEKVRRLRNLLMVSMMALQALRTIEVHRSNVEDLLEKGEQLTLLVRARPATGSPTCGRTWADG